MAFFQLEKVPDRGYQCHSTCCTWDGCNAVFDKFTKEGMEKKSLFEDGKYNPNQGMPPAGGYGGQMAPYGGNNQMMYPYGQPPSSSKFTKSNPLTITLSILFLLIIT